MNLNLEQLHQIRDLIAKRGFLEVDIQMEILDHIASSVEEKKIENPTLNFDAAVNETIQSFGVMGLSAFADGLTNSIRAKYSRLFWRFFFSAFGYKYVLLLCFSIFGIYKMQGLLTANVFYIFLVTGLLCVFGISVFSTIKPSLYKKFASFKSGNSFLPLLGGTILLTNFAMNIVPVGYTIFAINVQQLVVSLSIVLFILYFNAAIRTAKISIMETKSLIEKYRLLYN
ncbi:hypothetical protein ASE74_11375 [Pedobacter sp. Leaf216]|uniref:hypothetical protein n=1 Tax=Pedobacter sp. Leaf216 TaxID=1735684 RepID=UPI0006F66E3E|nr:hypothetical protein [Pedobacter sp. Leaf216]KQM64614.1 hypothetical protein ASE74_11375 [Pedobacter sp. Leaf216]